MKTETGVGRHVMEEVRHLTESTYIIRFSRNGMEFNPGQHLVIGLEDEEEAREYSIYSGREDDALEVLIKEVDDGYLSRKLKHLKPGDPLLVKGPFGFFMSEAAVTAGAKLIFIASGTGIAPFHSFIRSHPSADYLLIHGIRNAAEEYEKEEYAAESYISCTSRGNQGTCPGRVTDYLSNNAFETDSQVFLCGNSNMIYDAMDILQSKGFTPKQLFTEVYF
jgi:ferredoxin-NADP reductase